MMQMPEKQLEFLILNMLEILSSVGKGFLQSR